MPDETTELLGRGTLSAPPEPIPEPEHDVGPDPFPGEFRLLERLGGGAFGVVHKALDLSPLSRLVALKFLSTRQAPAVTLAALRNEARLLASVEHPNIVRVHAWKQAGSLPCLVLQYVAGGSLTGVLRREGPLPWARAARYIADVAAGLELMHARGVFHRDIKPENILLDPSRDEALLTDLGIATRLGDGPTASGTIPYMPPEAFDRTIGPAHDVFSLAATLFVLVTGELPFSTTDLASHLAAVANGLPEPESRLMGVPAALEQLMRDGLSADGARRPSLPEFSARLRGALNALLADSLATPAEGLRLIVSRREGAGYMPVAASTQGQANDTRDMRRVPPVPARVRLRTGDRVRIEVEASETGQVVVFNIGPTGNLNLLGGPVSVTAGELLRILDVELTPPTGNERVFALWTRRPLTLRLEELRALVEGGAYRATRDMANMKRSLENIPAHDRRTVVLELEHA